MHTSSPTICFRRMPVHRNKDAKKYVRRDLGVPRSDHAEYKRRYRLVATALADLRLGLTKSPALDEVARLGISLTPEPFTTQPDKLDLYKIPFRLRRISSTYAQVPPFLRCSACGTEKPHRSFGKCKTGRHGFQSRCKACLREIGRERRQRDKEAGKPPRPTSEARKLQQRLWKKRHKDKVAEYQRNYMRRRRAAEKAAKTEPQ